jgi:hypothetical protein
MMALRTPDCARRILMRETTDTPESRPRIPLGPAIRNLECGILNLQAIGYEEGNPSPVAT